MKLKDYKQIGLDIENRRNELEQLILTSDDRIAVCRAKNEIHELNNKGSEYNNCFIEYRIGFRVYYKACTKIGKKYFINFKPLTRSNGYTVIRELEEITEEMKTMMNNDIKYY